MNELSPLNLIFCCGVTVTDSVTAMQLEDIFYFKEVGRKEGI